MTFARLSLSASACLAMARCICWGRSISFNSTKTTLMPHGSVWLSRISWSRLLIFSRSARSSSRSAWPQMLRSVTCASSEVDPEHLLHERDHINDTRPASRDHTPQAKDYRTLVLLDDFDAADDQKHYDNRGRCRRCEIEHDSLL